jgi:hypothetical protein
MKLLPLKDRTGVQALTRMACAAALAHQLLSVLQFLTAGGIHLVC